MTDDFCTLPKRIEEMFGEIDSETLMCLKARNEEYATLLSRLEEIQKQNPFINDILEETGPISLTAEEHEAFTEYTRLYMDRDNMERRELYFRGHTDGYAYLKKIGAV